MNFIELQISKLPDYRRKKLRALLNNIKSIGIRSNLTKLAILYKTDKWGAHFYTPHYQYHFKKFRLKKINFLEIGVGGYEKPKSGGESLRMWKKYFSFAKIFSFDIHDKSFHEERRIKIFRGSQIDEPFLQNLVKEIGVIDIIVDDGSHINNHVIKTFTILFPLL